MFVDELMFERAQDMCTKNDVDQILKRVLMKKAPNNVGLAFR